MRRVVTLLTIAILALLVGAGTAQAHSELTGSTPMADAVLTAAPTSVELVFNQQIQDQFATVTVTGAGGGQADVGAPSVQGDRVLLPLTGQLSSGQYTVGYRVISEDGHPITGSFGFTVAAPAPTETPGNAAAPTTSATTPTTTSAASQQESGSGASMILPILGIVVATVLVVGVVIVMRGGRGER